MNGTEIDQLISDVLARKARAIELAWRADCKRRELSARTFLAENKNHASDAPLPHTAHDCGARCLEDTVGLPTGPRFYDTPNERALLKF